MTPINTDKFGETCITDGGTCGLGGYCKDCPYLKKDSPASKHTPHRCSSVSIGGLLCSILLALLAVTVNFAVFSGCAVFGGRSRDWYNGPSEYKEATRNAINISIAELSAELGRPLKFRWDRDQITVNVPPPDGHVHGIPAVRNPHHGGLVWGYTAGRRAVVPAGHRPSALVHEVGHVVMHVNGMQSIDPETHHRMAPRFFRKHNGR